MATNIWGAPNGVPAGADVLLEAVLTIDGAVHASQVTSSGSVTLSVGTVAAQLTDESADAVTSSTGLVRWNITSAQTSSWTAGVHDGDIKLVDSGGTVTFWPVSLQVRSVID